MPDSPLVLSLADHQPSLRQVADRLLTLTQTLLREHGVPDDLAAELAIASTRCAHAHFHLECLLESLDFFRSGLDDGLARLRRECPCVNERDRLRPNAQGQYAWDRWQAEALAAGLRPDLAGLGRAVMREAVQHDWSVRLQAECGWRDAGQAMLELALGDGAAAARRWTFLLETDGLRGRWTPDGEWQSGLGGDDPA